MRAYLVLFLLLFFSVPDNIAAQSVNGTPMDEIDVDYIRIVGKAKFLSPKVLVNIEFGQIDKLWDQKDTQIMNDAHATTVGNQNVYHYLMKKVKY